MAGIFAQLKSFDLESTAKSRYAEIDSLPFMKSTFHVPIIAAAYVLFVLKIGPQLMKNREPFKLRAVLIVYNAFQVLLSMYIVYLGTKYWRRIGIFSTNCTCADPSIRNEILSSMWVFVFAKITELLDTIFFVLRKKDAQISFLHVYHHTVMVILCWSYLKWNPSDAGLSLGYFNAVVHVVMYSYYLLSAFGPHMAPYLTWKKYITTMQLVQFVAGAVVFFNNIKYSECPPPTLLSTFILANLFFFMYLFGKFYNENYVTKQQSKKTK